MGREPSECREEEMHVGNSVWLLGEYKSVLLIAVVNSVNLLSGVNVLID